MADDNIKDVGFAIVLPTEGQIEERAQEKLDRELTDSEWEKIGEDLSIMEYNAVEYLKEKLDQVRDEGHGSRGDLIGTAWYDADDKEQVDFVMFREQNADYPDMDVGEQILNKGLSEIGEEILSDDTQIEFFAVDENDIETWEDEQ